MTNRDTELYELCKQVYACSDFVGDAIWPHDNYTPIYSSDYLLDSFKKADLSVVLRYNHDMGGRAGMRAWDGKFCAGTFDMPQGEYPIAETALKCLLLLTLKLIDQGIDLGEKNDH